MSEESQASSGEFPEQVLGPTDELFRTIVAASPDMIAVTDLQGNLLYFSNAGLEMFTLSRREEALCHNLLEYIIPEHRERVQQNLAKLTTRLEKPGEYLAMKSDGQMFWIEVNGAMMHDSEGHARRMLFIVRDISSRKVLDSELKKSEERLALANRKLALLGSMTRHDILNKLTAMTGYLELAMMTNQDVGIAKNLEKVKKAAGAIQKQMEVTRTYQQLGTVEPTWIDAPLVIRLELTSIDTGAVKAELSVPEVEVLGDPLFANCIHNLIDNAIRHGGKTTHVRITGREEGGSFVIAIEDDGFGIPAGQKEAIFDWTYNGRGGHGLNFVREALRSLGMDIEEIGIEGQGARFEITVPPGCHRKKT